jgi:hypothetical protein
MDERRAHCRVSPRERTTARVVRANPPTSQGALVRDLSPLGVRLLTSERLPPNTLLLLELPGLEVIAARVTHSAEEADGTWVAGCALLGELDREALGRLAC